VKKTKNIKSYLDEYLKICQNRNLSPSTIGGYEKCLSALSALHKMHVSELTQRSSKLDRQQKNKAENDQE
jgi:integrase